MAGAGAGGGFHVAFGINETQLTSLLEQANYTAAEQHIRDNDDSSYLDEGLTIKYNLVVKQIGQCILIYSCPNFKDITCWAN